MQNKKQLYFFLSDIKKVIEHYFFRLTILYNDKSKKIYAYKVTGHLWIVYICFSFSKR